MELSNLAVNLIICVGLPRGHLKKSFNTSEQNLGMYQTELVRENVEVNDDCFRILCFTSKNAGVWSVICYGLWMRIADLQ